jgi:hypothetical protein
VVEIVDDQRRIHGGVVGAAERDGSGGGSGVVEVDASDVARAKGSQDFGVDAGEFGELGGGPKPTDGGVGDADIDFDSGGRGELGRDGGAEGDADGGFVAGAFAEGPRDRRGWRGAGGPGPVAAVAVVLIELDAGTVAEVIAELDGERDAAGGEDGEAARVGGGTGEGGPESAELAAGEAGDVGGSVVAEVDRAGEGAVGAEGVEEVEAGGPVVGLVDDGGPGRGSAGG